MYLKRVLGKYWLQSVLSWTGGPSWQLAALFSTRITNSPSTIRMHNIVLFYAFFASNTAHRVLSFYFCILFWHKNHSKKDHSKELLIWKGLAKLGLLLKSFLVSQSLGLNLQPRPCPCCIRALLILNFEVVQTSFFNSKMMSFSFYV